MSQERQSWAANLLLTMQAVSEAGAHVDVALEITRRLVGAIRDPSGPVSPYSPWIAELELVGKELSEARRLIGEV